MKARKQQPQIGRLVLSLISVLVFAGCATVREPETSYDPEIRNDNNAIKVVIEDAGNQELKTRRIKRNNPQDVISHARNLSEAGRHGDAADVFIDASKKFQSVGKEFEMNCRKEAVRELYHNGNYQEAKNLLDSIDAEQDIYGRTSENTCFRKLREMVNQKAVAAKMAKK